METYEKYKPSGIDWIGEVPGHWEPFRIKYALSRSAAGVWGDDEKGDENDILCYRIADFDYYHGCLMLDNLTTRNIEPKQLEGRIVKKGDLLIEKSGGGDVSPVGRVVKVNSDQRATYTNFIHSVSVKDGYSSNYLYYYFFNLYALKINLLFFNQTTGLQNLKVGDYLGQTIFLPPIAEQEAIAAYLDARCADIDKVVVTQQKRIALLQELKQSEITQAVTRGLNPDARMKDSGVEWIGMVPEHWEVCKLKYFLNLINGRAYLQHELQEAGKYRILRVGNFFTNDQWYYSDFELEPEKYCEKGDLLFAWSASFGPYIWDEEKVIYHYHIWKVLLTRGFNKFYAYYMLQSLSDYKRKDVHGSTMTHITMESMNQTKIPVPSKDEQAFIAEYLDRRCGEIDKQIGAVTKQIELLREYKQALITEVVTGKRRV